MTDFVTQTSLPGKAVSGARARITIISNRSDGRVRLIVDGASYEVDLQQLKTAVENADNAMRL